MLKDIWCYYVLSVARMTDCGCFLRFDLIYLILDKADEHTDRHLAKHIVSLHFENPEVWWILAILVTWSCLQFSENLFCLQSAVHDVLDIATLTAYMSYARKYIQPQLSDEAAEELTRGYVEMRRRGNFPGSSKKVCS